VSELKEEYPDAKIARDGEKTLVKLPSVYFPVGCKPEKATALVLIEPTQPQPQLLLQIIPLLPNGGSVSASPMTIAGEAWFTYSFNLQWDEHRHTAFQFVEGRLRRFSLNA
jgi:hypothetical protein